MTEVNLNGNICFVDGMAIGTKYRTQVWISKQAADGMEKELVPQDFENAVRKVLMFAQGGFFNYERPGGPIRHEGNQVYRIAYKSDTLFRLVGFYGDDTRREFVIIDAFTKHGKKLRGPERERIAAVGRIRETRTWQKRDPQ